MCCFFIRISIGLVDDVVWPSTSTIGWSFRKVTNAALYEAWLEIRRIYNNSSWLRRRNIIILCAMGLRPRRICWVWSSVGGKDGCTASGLDRAWWACSTTLVAAAHLPSLNNLSILLRCLVIIICSAAFLQCVLLVCVLRLQFLSRSAITFLCT